MLRVRRVGRLFADEEPLRQKFSALVALKIAKHCSLSLPPSRLRPRVRASGVPAHLSVRSSRVASDRANERGHFHLHCSFLSLHPSPSPSLSISHPLQLCLRANIIYGFPSPLVLSSPPCSSDAIRIRRAIIRLPTYRTRKQSRRFSSRHPPPSILWFVWQFFSSQGPLSYLSDETLLAKIVRPNSILSILLKSASKVEINEGPTRMRHGLFCCVLPA